MEQFNLTGLQLLHSLLHSATPNERILLRLPLGGLLFCAFLEFALFLLCQSSEDVQGNESFVRSLLEVREAEPETDQT